MGRNLLLTGKDMIGFRRGKKALLRGACILCLAIFALPALPAAEEGFVELGEDSKGAWSLYLPSVEERVDNLGSMSTSYIVGWVQVIYKPKKSEESKEIDIEELAQGNENAAQVLEFLVELGKMLDSGERYRGMFLFAANKELRQIQRISAAYYDEDGGEVSRRNGFFNPFLWKECPPGSMDEKIWQALMKASGKR